MQKCSFNQNNDANKKAAPKQQPNCTMIKSFVSRSRIWVFGSMAGVMFELVFELVFEFVIELVIELVNELVFGSVFGLMLDWWFERCVFAGHSHARDGVSARG